MKTLVVALCALASLAVAPSALAHRPSDSYLRVSLDPDHTTLSGHWDIALRDLDYALALDDGDGALTWGELVARQADVRSYASGALAFSADGHSCALTLGEISVSALSDGRYARVPVHAHCPETVRNLQVSYGLMRGLDPQHRGIFRLTDGGAAADEVLVAGAPPTIVPALGQVRSAPASLVERVGQGFSHILSGADHVLFLIALLLGTALVRDPGAADAPPAPRRVLLDLVHIVSAFTLAHSLTLGLAALGLVSVSAQIIEPAIAASVALAALANLMPMFGRDRWVVPFALGLLHGFGFSSGLTDAGLARTDLWLALLGFNLGVELGQLAVVVSCVPLVLAVRSRAPYRKLVLYGGSVATLALALGWFIERLEMG